MTQHNYTLKKLLLRANKLAFYSLFAGGLFTIGSHLGSPEAESQNETLETPILMASFTPKIGALDELISQSRKPNNIPQHSTNILDESKVSEKILKPEKNKPLSKEDILSDQKNKLSRDFKIPEKLKKRVGFWFDVYTQYTANQHIIHHMDYPWIIYEVVDVTDILNGPGHKWTKYHKSVRHVKNRRLAVMKTLKSLSRKKRFTKLSKEERRIYNLLKQAPGNVKSATKKAHRKMRVQLGQKDFMLSGIENSGRYIEEMEKIFESRNLPLELTRLPLVESSFNEKAFSKVGASGIWQIMPYIGKKFLIMKKNVDERNNPIKATTAAARLLDQNLKIMKTWPLAITAYNHGTGGLLKAVKKMKTNDIVRIIDRYESKSFGFASSNFYTSFLAALYSEKYHEEVFGKIERKERLEYATVTLTKPLRLKNIMKSTGLTKEDFHSLNLDIKKDALNKNVILPRGYKIFLPKESVGQVEALLIPSKGRKVSVR